FFALEAILTERTRQAGDASMFYGTSSFVIINLLISIWKGFALYLRRKRLDRRRKSYNCIAGSPDPHGVPTIAEFSLLKASQVLGFLATFIVFAVVAGSLLVMLISNCHIR
ncbi:hypothetical protein PENTCL1PPCAC_21686, partial [Pristionchus entomophagus]